MRLAIAWLSMAGLFSALPALAQDDTDYARSGPYVSIGVSGVFPTFEYSQTGPFATGEIKSKPSSGINPRVGWRVFPYLAVEAQYEWFDAIEIVGGLTGDGFSPPDRTDGEVDVQFFTGNLKLFAPLDAPTHPYLIGGVGAAKYNESGALINKSRAQELGIDPQVDFDGSEWEMILRFGLGFDFYVTDHLVVNIEATGIYSNERLFDDESIPFATASGNLQWRF